MPRFVIKSKSTGEIATLEVSLEERNYMPYIEYSLDTDDAYPIWVAESYDDAYRVLTTKVSDEHTGIFSPMHGFDVSQYEVVEMTISCENAE